MVPRSAGSVPESGIRRRSTAIAVGAGRRTVIRTGRAIARRLVLDRLAGGVALLVGAGPGLASAFEFLEAELVVFLHLAHLLLHLQDLEIQFLDRAAELADLLFETGHPRVDCLGEQRTALRHPPSKTPGRPECRTGAPLCAPLRGAAVPSLAIAAVPVSSSTASALPVMDRNLIASPVRTGGGRATRARMPPVSGPQSSAKFCLRHDRSQSGAVFDGHVVRPRPSPRKVHI